MSDLDDAVARVMGGRLCRREANYAGKSVTVAEWWEFDTGSVARDKWRPSKKGRPETLLVLDWLLERQEWVTLEKCLTMDEDEYQTTYLVRLAKDIDGRTLEEAICKATVQAGVNNA